MPTSLGREHRPATHQVGIDRQSRESAERQDALLVALARDDHREVLEVDLVDIEIDNLGDPRARAVEELDEGPVAQPGGRAKVAGVLDQREDLFVREGLGQSARNRSWPDIARWIDRRGALTHDEAMKGPNRHHDTSRTRGAERRLLRR